MDTKVLDFFVFLSRGQHNPSIHRLCTAFPSFILPPYLQLVSRVYHTLDRRGHNILFTAEDMDNKEEEPMCSKSIYLKEQAERKRYELTYFQSYCGLINFVS